MYFTKDRKSKHTKYVECINVIVGICAMTENTIIANDVVENNINHFVIVINVSRYDKSFLFFLAYMRHCKENLINIFEKTNIEMTICNYIY